jgi:hypothetical protein
MLADQAQAPISADDNTDRLVPDPPAQGVESDTEHCRRILLRLIDIGAEIAEMVREDAAMQSEYCRTVSSIGPTPQPTPEPTAAYDRVTRAIRRNVILLHKLPELACKAPGLACKANEPPKSRPKQPDRIAARKRIIRDVEDTIQRTTKGDDAERLHAELIDRLDSPDLDDEIGDRPVAEIITDICRDLGIAHSQGTHPWKRRAPADIAILAARAAKTSLTGAPDQPVPKFPDHEIPAVDVNVPPPPRQQTANATGSDPP